MFNVLHAFLILLTIAAVGVVLAPGWTACVGLVLAFWFSGDIVCTNDSDELRSIDGMIWTVGVIAFIFGMIRVVGRWLF